MTPTLLRKNRCCFALIAATEDELLRANGFLPTGRLGVAGDPEYRSPEGFTCSRPTALVLIAEATLGEGDGAGAEQGGAHHQEHRGQQRDAVHGSSFAADGRGGECAR